MLRKGIALAALSLCTIPALSSSANAQAVERGPWELTLGAGAAHGPDLNGFSGSANASIGYYLTPELELSGRQTLSYTDVGGGDGSAWNASTRVALDLHFPLGERSEFQPFIGGNIGYLYGESIEESWIAGPEAGIKYYVNSSTFVFVLAEYQFFFDKGDDASDAFSDGQFVYTAGIGFRF